MQPPDVADVAGTSDPPPPADVRVDGRTLRTERTRRIVVDAVLDLIADGVMTPTARAVSERSGVSLRSIFRLFDDVESLQAAAVAVQAERIAPLMARLSEKGDTSTRVMTLVAARAALWEAITPVRRVALRLAATSPQIRRDLANMDRWARRQVDHHFAPELDRLDDAQRRRLADTLDALSSWEFWNRLRTGQQLSRDDAGALMASALIDTLDARRPTGARRRRSAKGGEDLGGQTVE